MLNNVKSTMQRGCFFFLMELLTEDQEKGECIETWSRNYIFRGMAGDRDWDGGIVCVTQRWKGNVKLEDFLKLKNK